MQFIKKEYKKFGKNSYDSFVLGADIGGTNTSLGLFGIKAKLVELLLSFHFQSQLLKCLSDAVNGVLNYLKTKYSIKTTRACLAVAGYLSPDKSFAHITNVQWNVSKKTLASKTKLKKIILVNDFEAIGYGINLLGKKDILVVKKARKIPKAPILVIGPGTGLGKTILVYNENQKSYVTIPSEAGHSDFSAQTDEDLQLVNFIKKHRKIKQGVSYEQVLSGQGIVNIYLFLRKNKKFKATKYTKEIDNAQNKPELISKYRKIDITCNDTFNLFKRISAIFARNFALDCLPRGGIYIGGGIAPKNKEIFDIGFVKIFQENYKLQDVLKKTPIYLILNYDVGMLGAGFVAAKYLN